MITSPMLVAALVTFTVAAALTPALAWWAHRHNVLDVPNHRSSHVVATPRTGGIGIVSAVLSGVAVLQLTADPVGSKAIIVLGGAVALSVLGLIDDLRDLPAILRLIVQVVVAGVVVTLAGPVPLPWVQSGTVVAVLTVGWLVTLTNAYNFMDGIDGIAGGQALVAGAGWLGIGLVTGSSQIASLGLLLAAASSGFLLYNWYPAKVFMGDAGSGFLGFAFAALPLVATAGQGTAWWVGLLLVWPFLFDTGFTLVRRAMRRENLLLAHRSHIYQRLVRNGRSHSHVALLYVGLAVLGAAVAVFIASP